MLAAALRLEYACSSWKKTAKIWGCGVAVVPSNIFKRYIRTTGLNSLIYGSASIPDGTVQPQDWHIFSIIKPMFLGVPQHVASALYIAFSLVMDTHELPLVKPKFVPFVSDPVTDLYNLLHLRPTFWYQNFKENDSFVLISFAIQGVASSGGFDVSLNQNSENVEGTICQREKFCEIELWPIWHHMHHMAIKIVETPKCSKCSSHPLPFPSTSHLTFLDGLAGVDSVGQQVTSGHKNATSVRIPLWSKDISKSLDSIIHSCPYNFFHVNIHTCPIYSKIHNYLSYLHKIK